MALFEFLATQDRTFRDRLREFSSLYNRLLPCARAQTDRHVNRLIRVSWAYLSCSFQRKTLTTGKWKLFLRSRHKSPFTWAESSVEESTTALPRKYFRETPPRERSQALCSL